MKQLNQKQLVIGVASVARAGKNTFARLLQEAMIKTGHRCAQYALASALKYEVKSFLWEKFGISALTENTEDKNKIREFLVWYGKLKRESTQGRYFINILDPIIRENAKHNVISIITDIRYDFYKKDEIYWIKQELGGIIVYIEKYSTVNGQKVYVQPPNKEERTNCPKLKSVADYVLEWEHVDYQQDINKEKQLYPYVEQFIETWKKLT